jgi:DNA-binding NtrC family response regulator
LAEGTKLFNAHLLAAVLLDIDLPDGSGLDVLPAAGILLDEAELSFVRQAIERSGGNQTRAAELLGISRDQLRYRLKKLEEAQVISNSVT